MNYVMIFFRKGVGIGGMNRRQVLLRTVTVISGFSGCNETGFGKKASTPTDRHTDSPTPSETATASPDRPDRVTPSPDFSLEWLFDHDEDWSERHRLTEYPHTVDYRDLLAHLKLRSSPHFHRW
jgi:hypothetical protein